MNKALLVVLSVLFLLFILEIFLRFKILIPASFDNEAWWKYRWHISKKSFENSFSEFPDQFDPELGWLPKKNFSAMTEFGSLTFNSIGIRSNKEFAVQKGTKKRIVTVGDSFTYGECVADGETYSDYLEDLSDNTEVMNFGVHGYGLDQELLRLKKALVYSPDIVIVGFYNPDISRILFSFREYHKPKFGLKKGRLVLTNSPLPSPDEYSQKPHLLVVDLMEMYLFEIKNRFYPEKKLRLETDLANAILEEMVNTSLKSDAGIYFLYLPSFEEISQNNSSPHSSFTSVCQKKRVVCIDPTSSLNRYIKESANPSRLFRCHYAKEIHSEIAKDIKKFITD